LKNSPGEGKLLLPMEYKLDKGKSVNNRGRWHWIRRGDITL